jgi:hypothetical protein
LISLAAQVREAARICAAHGVIGAGGGMRWLRWRMIRATEK